MDFSMDDWDYFEENQDLLKVRMKNDLPSMGKDRNQMAAKLLSLALEIIDLITGEEHTVVRKTSGDCVSGRWSRSQTAITSPPHSPIHQKKILEVTAKITELLTGEVPLRCQDVTVYFSMEEWDYLGRHKNRYKDVLMGSCRPPPLRDGSSRRNPPGRCPTPLVSLDGPEENVLDNNQDADLIDIKVEVVDDEEEAEVTAEQQYGRRVRNPPDRCPAPMYSQDRPESQQGGDLTENTLQDEEETMMGDQQCMSDMKEEIPGDETTEKSRKNIVESVMLPLHSRIDDADTMQNTSGENLNNILPRLHSKKLFYHPPNHMESLHEQSKIITSISCKYGKRFQCGDCGKQFTQSSSLFIHRRIHTGEKPYTCSLCGKCFTRKSGLDQHERRHTGEKLYSCLVCGKCFVDKSNLVKHDRIHTGEKPYSCLECGKCFTNKSHLVLHERSHTGEKPFSCSECEKCFTNRSHLVTHERIHTGEKPYLCTECGKCFITKTKLRNHQKIHTGEKPFTCSECGKCYINKSDLVKHERIHTGEKPYSCSECEKCFTDKSSLVTHQRIHPGE